MVLEYTLYSWECVLIIILAMPIVPAPQNPTASKCLPSSTSGIWHCWPLPNGFIIHIIFLRVCLSNDIGHAGGACFPKLSWRKLPALEPPTDEWVSRAAGWVMGIVPGIYMNLLMPHWAPNSSVSKILRPAQNFWEGAGKIWKNH